MLEEENTLLEHDRKPRPRMFLWFERATVNLTTQKGFSLASVTLVPGHKRDVKVLAFLLQKLEAISAVQLRTNMELRNAVVSALSARSRSTKNQSEETLLATYVAVLEAQVAVMEADLILCAGLLQGRFLHFPDGSFQFVTKITLEVESPLQDRTIQ